jgi:hypothetical protein
VEGGLKQERTERMRMERRLEEEHRDRREREQRLELLCNTVGKRLEVNRITTVMGH